MALPVAAVHVTHDAAEAETVDDPSASASLRDSAAAVRSETTAI